MDEDKEPEIPLIERLNKVFGPLVGALILDLVDLPPREIGITWSMVKSLALKRFLQ